MRYTTLFLFLILSFSATSQTETRHHAGFSLAIDPASVILILMDKDDSDNENYEDEDSEDDDGFGALAFYCKYKPSEKWDFHGGLKLAFTSFDKFEYFHSDIHAKMTAQANLGLYAAINYTTRNPYSSYSGNPFFSTLEIGWAKPQGDLLISNINTDEQEVIKRLKGSFYIEAKVGLKAGWENNAFGFFLSANNMTYAKSANQQLKNRGLKEFSELGIAVHIGITYEFGFRKREKRKKNNTTTSYPDWFQPEEEMY